MTASTKLQALLATLSALPFLVAAVTNPVANPDWNVGTAEDPIPILDCLPGHQEVITQNFQDARKLATDAAEALEPPIKHGWWSDYFDVLFDDKAKAGTTYHESRTKIRNRFKGVSETYDLPREIIFHCSEEWPNALYARQSRAYVKGVKHNRPSWGGCEKDSTNGITYRIRSGGILSENDGDFGPNGAFRSGWHVMLCGKYFDKRPLGNIPPVAEEGISIDTQQNNQASIMLHELMHVYGDQILDGGYRYRGCIDVSLGRIPRDLDSVLPRSNADTYALFAMGVTTVANMRFWEWTSGQSRYVGPVEDKRSIMMPEETGDRVFGFNTNASISLRQPYKVVMSIASV